MQMPMPPRPRTRLTRRPAWVGQFDQDCGTCHLGMAALPVPATALPALARSEALIHGRVPHYRSADPRRLERPNWPAPAL